MKYFFFGYETKLTQSIDYIFTLNHLFLLLITAGIICALYFGLHAKSNNGIKITKIVLASILLVLEIGRTIYRYTMHTHNGGTASDFRWWWNISFQMCAIMCWTTIIVLFISAFQKKRGSGLSVFYNILFGAALVGAGLSFIYPDMIAGDRPLLHFLNFQTIIVHTLMIFVPIYLIKTGELKIRLKNIWMPAMGYLGIGAISMTASQISGENFAYALKTNLLEDIGINLPFPWHLPVTVAIVFIIPVIIYGVFELVYRLKNKGEKPAKEAIINKTMYIFFITAIAAGNVLAVLLLLFIPLMFSASPVGNLLGIFCLIPLGISIGSLYGGLYLKKLAFLPHKKASK